MFSMTMQSYKRHLAIDQEPKCRLLALPHKRDRECHGYIIQLVPAVVKVLTRHINPLAK